MTVDYAILLPDELAGREISPDDYAHDWEAGRRKMANWPSHMAEIVHANNAT